jgi:hypothetical protein
VPTPRRVCWYLRVRARHLARNRDYTVFLRETAGAPFGAAEYGGDISTDARGNADNELDLIVDEAFSSTVVNGGRVRVDPNQVGLRFADPADDEFCLGPNSPVTPLDGDNDAGVQALSSAPTRARWPRRRSPHPENATGPVPSRRASNLGSPGRGPSPNDDPRQRIYPNPCPCRVSDGTAGR